MKVLFFGDVVGGLGRRAIKKCINELKREYEIDFAIANGENSAGGLGLTYKTAADLFNMGIDAITLGNHTWSRREIVNFIDNDLNIVRPVNYSSELPGRGYIVIKNEKNNKKLGIINAQGQVYMDPIASPFRACESVLSEIKKETKSVVVDFHAEATSEKCAMAWFLDGKVSAVLGTHTHVQTADERILPCGTSFITDVGMTGPHESVIGMSVDLIVKKFLTQFPEPYTTATGSVQLNAVVIEIDEKTGKSMSIERISKVFSL